jgi:hypothetical protein
MTLVPPGAMIFAFSDSAVWLPRRSSRSGPIGPLEPAAASRWQLPHPMRLKTSRPGVELPTRTGSRLSLEDSSITAPNATAAASAAVSNAGRAIRPRRAGPRRADAR